MNRSQVTFRVPKLSTWGGIDEQGDAGAACKADGASRNSSNAKSHQTTTLAVVEFLLDQQRSFLAPSQLQVFQVTTRADACCVVFCFVLFFLQAVSIIKEK